MTKKLKITAIRFPNGETYEFDTIWNRALDKGECEPLHGKDGEAAVAEYKRAELEKLVPVGTTLTAVNDGKGNHMVFVIATGPDDFKYIRNITAQICDVAGFRMNKAGFIVQGGYGFSKSFQIGYSLGMSLWPNGTDKPHGTRNGEPDTNGGYAISVVAH